MIVPLDIFIQHEDNPSYEPPTNLGFNGQPLPVAIYPAVTTLPDEDVLIPIKTTAIVIQGATPVPTLTNNSTPVIVNTPVNTAVTTTVKDVLDYSGYSITDTSHSDLTVYLAIRFVVKNNNGTVLQGANIAINGTPTAQTDKNGNVFLPSVNQNDDIKVTYIGFGDVVFKAAKAPKEVVLTTTAIVLDPVSVTPAPPKPVESKKTNWFAWLLITGATVAVVKKMSKPEPKTAQVKI